MLDLFITSRVRRKVVILFSKYPDYKSHVRGIAKLIREDAGNIQRELSKLEDAGFLNSKKVKNTKVYSVNKAFALYKELQALVLKSRAQDKKETG
ncbi:MAG: ArsR family transcriptional regulator [Candidatus Saccharimonadales bacterium]